MSVEKTYWPSRASFVLAAMGSAIGLGNVWRFPYVCYENGGGAFLIPYLIALFTAGIPLMVLEMGLGHKMGASAPIAFARIGPKREWLGWLAVGVGFMIVSYYTVIMGWCVDYLGFSFKTAWGENTKDFFYSRFLNHSSNLGDVLSINKVILVGLAISWAMIILSIWKGAQTVGKVVYLTVPLPWICLLIFVIKGFTLPGAEDGIAYYLTPNFSKLLDSRVWLAAYSQVFFSLSIGFGVMIAYASFLPQKSDIVNNAFIVALADAGTAFLGGFAVFSTLGYYAHNLGVRVNEVLKSGIGLAFITYPSIINMLGKTAPFFGIVFFLMLITLAIDSAFSLVEAVAAGFMDKFGARRLKVNLSVGLVAFLIGLIFTSNAGLNWLDILDYFMNGFGLAVVGLLQCIVIGYFYGPNKIREHVNPISEFSIGKWWDLMIRIVVPIVLALLILNEIADRIKSAYGNYPRWAEFCGGWIVVIVLLTASILVARTREAK
ncbi:MAG: sodium-dependent transporter [bacterium]